MFVDFVSWISIFLVVIPFSFDPILSFWLISVLFCEVGMGKVVSVPGGWGWVKDAGSAWHGVFIEALRRKSVHFTGCLVVPTCSFVIFNATLRIALKSLTIFFNSKVPRKLPKHAILEWKTHPSLLGACILFPPDSSPVYVWTCRSGQFVTIWTLDPHSWNDLTVSCIESSIISYYFNDALQGSLPQYLSNKYILSNFFLMIVFPLFASSPPSLGILPLFSVFQRCWWAVAGGRVCRTGCEWMRPHLRFCCLGHRLQLGRWRFLGGFACNSNGNRIHQRSEQPTFQKILVKET